jgi:hypothetical protein
VFARDLFHGKGDAYRIGRGGDMESQDTNKRAPGFSQGAGQVVYQIIEITDRRLDFLPGGLCHQIGSVKDS